MVLVEQVQYEWALSSTRYLRPPKNRWQHLLFPITLTRACCVKSQLHCLMSHVPIDGPSTRPTNLEPHSWRGKLEPQLRDISHWKTDWPSSVLFWSWRMLECKFTTQDQRRPWVYTSSNIHLGSSIWAAIISARYCFVYFGSRMETLLHFARRRKLIVEEGEWCCTEEYTQYKTWVAWCGNSILFPCLPSVF